jgi:hypothetical protein
MAKTSTLEGGWSGPRVQVIAPHDQCLRWVKLGPRGAVAARPLSRHKENSETYLATSHLCQRADLCGAKELCSRPSLVTGRNRLWGRKLAASLSS